MNNERLNILLVEDDEDDYFLLHEELSAVGTWQPHVDWVSTYEEALSKIETSDYDVYFFDYNLGAFNGLQLLESIAGNRLSGPVIMITGKYDKKLDYNAMEAGIDDFLVKGRFDADMLERSIRYALERKKIEKQKDAFISVVSHELRTPLTSIKGSLGLISLGTVGPITEETKKMVDISERNCDRLIGIVNDLLDAQKLAAGKLEIDRLPLEIGEVLTKALEAHAGYAEKHNVLLRLETSTEAAWVEGDEARLLQVMANLLSNATKYSPDGGQITVHLEQVDNAKIRIGIADEGPGIPEAFRASIFGKFSQADTATTRKYAGTGLGLNIAKSIVLLHHGQIGFDTGPDGTTFFFDLPTMAPPGEA